ncbi:hypothetical protein BDW59DRAFT_173957 [Aspergillus cavernicola]|uniref:Ubiquitin 3 binding protein But2 C-terminal domain-containing protein n=1 Tax=Aspergillus cavernicola TaxID=176166 RepID=A0ABR4I3H0_9EURO
MKSSYPLILLTMLFSIVFAKDSRPILSWVVLDTENIQTASQHDGLPSNNSIGYAPSATDAANFINHCSKTTLTNGESFTGGSCNGIVMGNIPSEENMISTIITYPSPGEILPAGRSFLVKFQTANLVAGCVTNPNATLYSAPQALQDGKVVGHVHITIQTLSDYTRNDGDGSSIMLPDPTTFVFFQTVFGVGDEKGWFSVLVNDGLSAGFYRVCTMVAASNHQPVVMPVVERGAQDDCQKFRVGK